MKLWWQDNNIEMHSTYNEEKSIVAERFRTIKDKIYKYMSSVSKNTCIDKLVDQNEAQSNWGLLKKKECNGLNL